MENEQCLVCLRCKLSVMGIAERKEREKQEMKQRIIAAAMEMFLTEGYERTSIRNIADKIEYSPATIYLYYKDKDELLYEVQHEAFNKLGQYFAELISIQDPLKRLEAICRRYIQFSVDNPELYDLMFILKAPMNSIEEKDKWTNGVDAFEFLLQTVSECVDKGLIRFKDKMVGAFSIWSIGHGMISLNIRCRIKVMEMTESDTIDLINQSLDEYLELIKT